MRSWTGQQIDTIYQDAIHPYEYWPMEDIGGSVNMDAEVAAV